MTDWRAQAYKLREDLRHGIPGNDVEYITAALERAAAQEREECLSVIANLHLDSPTAGPEYRQGYNLARERAIDAIRGRAIRSAP